jgi:hypothetical protein
VPGTTATLDRLELRIGRLGLVFRFTYAFHAREVRFECDRGDGFERIFPETFSFHPDRHDPAEIFLQLQDLASKPRLLAPAARRRDAEVLISRFLLAVPRYLEKLLHRLEGDARLDAPRLDRVYTDVALLAQIVTRFGAGRVGEEQQGIRMAVLHLRKLAYRTLFRLVERRVDPDYLAGYVAGTADLIDPGDDLSESGFFHTLENGEPDAVNRTLLRLGERAFYRWLEDVCLDEQNGAFEVEDSPFESREIEVRRAISTDGRLLVERGRELVPFLRRPGNRDCLRLLEKLEAWFLRQYDIHHAAVMIQHADNVANQIDDAERILSRHRTRNYVMALAAMAIPFVGAAIAYDRAPRLFDALCSLELVLANLAVLWFLFYRFLWRRNLTFFYAGVPRITAGIIVGYLPIFFIDEVWGLANRPWPTLSSIVVLLGSVTLLYLYVEVQRRLGDTTIAFGRARQIFLLGLLQAAGIGLIFTGLVGRFMALRNWSPDPGIDTVPSMQLVLPPFVGQLPRIVGVEPFYTFPAAVFMMAFMAYFIGTFLQLMWEDLPITEPL